MFQIRKKRILIKIFIIWIFVLKMGLLFSKQDLKTAQEYYLEGKKLLLKGDYEGANKAFQKAEEILSKCSSGEELKQKTLYIKKEVKSLQPKVAKNNLKNISTQAKLAFEEGKYKKALDFYKELLKMHSKNSNLYYNLGVIYLKEANYIKAAQAFEKVVCLNPSDADAYYNLGVLYESYLNDKEKAIAYYKKYLKFSSSDREKKEVKKWIKEISKKIQK